MNSPEQVDPASAEQETNQAGQPNPGPPPIRIGELLVLSGLVTQENLDSSISLSSKLKMPLGRILSMHGHLTEDLLVKSLEVLERIRSQQMTLEHGLSILRTLHDNHTFVQVDEKSNLDMQLVNKKQPVLEILKKIGAVSEKQKESARKLSEETGLPGGWVLLGQGLITAPLLNAAIVSQRTIENRYLTEEKGLALLRVARMNQMSFQQVLEQENIEIPPLQSELIKAHLFLDAGLVNSSELLASQELASILHMDMEQLMWHVGLLSKESYESLRGISQQISEGLAAEDAFEAIHSLTHPHGESETTGSEALELLKDARIVSEDDLNAAVEKAYQQRQPLLKALMAENLIDENLASALNECQKLLEEHSISMDQAKILVSYCADTKKDITSALNEFGWRGSRLISAGR
jgi:hypothetical protein